MKWILLKDRMPKENIDGDKVLICRLLNEGQRDQAISIMPTHMIRHSNDLETWWMSLPELPKELINNER